MDAALEENGEGTAIDEDAWSDDQHSRAVHRALATGVDYAAGAAGAVALWLLIGRRRTASVSELLPLALLTAPVTTVLAVAEATGGSPGKRLLGLQVVDAASGAPVSLGRAGVRSLLKVALPWELAHAAVWRFRSPDEARRRSGVLPLLASYAWVGASSLGVLTSGAALHDRTAGTRVVTRRRPAPPDGPPST